MRQKSEAASVLLVLIHACVCLVRGDIRIATGEPYPGHPGSDTHPSKQVIESFHVQTDIRYRFATTKMCSVVRNTAGIAREMPFHVTLPKEAFIVSFAMTIDGKVYDGEVKEKNAAKEQYNRAVQRGQSAGHVRQTPRHSNRFDVSVNVANGTAVNFTLIYQQILSRKLGVYEYQMHVEPGQAVKDFNVEVFIQENRPLLFVKTPKLRKASTISNKIEQPNALTTVDRPSSTTAHIQYKPNIIQQGKDGLAARFIVQYDVEHSPKGDVLVADGYFIHLFSPKPPRPLPKDIIFVLDVSGSMSGKKIRQLKQAMEQILEDLTLDDRFNILTFSSDVSKWKPVLTKVTPEIIQEAQQFVNKMDADGATNIDLAIRKALGDLPWREVQNRVGMIFFLTDGEATEGETDTRRIVRNIKRENVVKTSIYTLAFGQGANFESLKTISTQNFGYARKIYEASDAALQVESLYDEISTVAMKNVSVKYLPSVTKTTETAFPIVHNGTEIMIGGCIDLRLWDEKLLPENSSIFLAEIEGREKEGVVDIVLEIDDIDEVTIDDHDSLNSFFTMPRDYSGIVEKMWAFLTIKQMLTERQVVIEEKDKVEKLNEQILEMSLKYKFVTPLTSMVVTKPDTDSPLESGLQDADEEPRPPVMAHRRVYGPNRGTITGQNAMSHAISASAIRPYTPFKSSRRGGGQSFDLSGLPGLVPNSRYPNRKLISSPPSGSNTPRLPNRSSKRGRRVKKRRRNNGKSIGILKTIVLRTDKTSLCLAPKKITEGKYLLAAVDTTGNSSKGFRAELITECFRKCRHVVPKTLLLSSRQKTTRINMKTLDTWEYHQHPDFDVAFVKLNEMVLKHDNITVSIVRTQKRKKMFFSLELQLSSDATTSSNAMTDLMKAKMRRQRRVPKVCVNSKADVSMYFTKGKALKYQV